MVRVGSDCRERRRCPPVETDPKTEAELEGYEAAFRRDGLPMLIEDYSPAYDIFTRAVPLLGFVLLLELLGPVNADFSLALNIAAVLVAVGLMLLALALVNRHRGRPMLSRPRKVGKIELVAFVIVPALLPGLISDHWGIAALTALFNLLLLALILGVVGFGLISILRWAVGRILSELSRSFGLLVKAVPLLMIFSLILFLTPELWEVFAQLQGASLAILVGLFVLLGAAFLIARLPKEVEGLERDAGGDGPPLKTRQRFNVGLVLFISQSLQVLLVALAVAAFFVVFGLLTINAELIEGWIKGTPDVLFGFELGGRQAQLTVELLRVATAIASFTGLYFAISMMTDDLYRREFLDRITDEMKQTFARRAAYLALRERNG
jgi:MFS family permease